MADDPTDLHYLEIAELAPRLRARELSPVELTRAALRRIEALDARLRSFVAVTAERALADAARAERELASGRHRGPLHGVPLGVKDLFFTDDAPAAGGMPIHAGFRPGEDATAVARLREAGAVLLGKLQMTEGAYSDHHPSVAPPRNPWDERYWTGISSSGPAAATAAGLCAGALASDTGGSIRWPAAATGLTGIKPTWGRVSRHGAYALAPSMDHVGPLARSAADAGAILRAIAGPDPRDPTSFLDPPDPPDRPTAAGAAPTAVAGMRIAVDPGWNTDDCDPDVRAALTDAADVLRSLGAELVEVDGPDLDAAVADWVPLCAAEAALAHAATYPARRDEYGPVLAGVLDAGRALTAIEHAQALARRRELRGRIAQLFTDANAELLLTPVQTFSPLTLERISTLGEQPELIRRLQRFTAPFDLTGSPTITFPAGSSDAGLPIAVQLVGPHRSEERLIAAAAAFQRETAFHRRHPDLADVLGATPGMPSHD